MHDFSTFSKPVASLAEHNIPASACKFADADILLILNFQERLENISELFCKCELDRCFSFLLHIIFIIQSTYFS